MIVKSLLSAALLLSLAGALRAQSSLLPPLGGWRAHPSYQSLTSLALAGGRVYGGSAGGLFYYDRAAGQPVRLGRLDGLAESAVSCLAYEPVTRQLFIGYESGNLDVLTQTPGQPDRVRNLPALRNAPLMASRRPRDILFRGSLAYVLGDFGVLVLDLARGEVRETYRNLGPGGAPVRVLSGAFAQDSLYLGTPDGVLAAAMAPGVNRQDFANWQPRGLRGRAVPALTGGARLYAGVDGEGVLAYRAGRWNPLLPTSLRTLRAVDDATLVVSAPGRVLVLRNETDLTAYADPLLADPRQATLDAAGSLWVADGQRGLVGNADGTFRSYAPNGPATNDVFQLYQYPTQGNKTGGPARWLSLPGGYDANGARLGRPAALSVFDGTTWTNRTAGNAPALAGFTDLTAATYQPATQRLYLGSFGQGLLTQATDGTLAPAVGTPLGPGTRVTGLATATDGTVWTTSYDARPALHALTPSGTWQSFSFVALAARYPLGVLPDGNGFAWCRLDPGKGGGLLVFDRATNRTRLLTTEPGNGGLPSNAVRSLVLDQQGQVWAGTDNGAFVFLDPGSVFAGNYAGFAPLFDGRRLLAGESVTALAVDGGNRKWMGTRRGLWLFSADGTELVSHFTQANSPLPSDDVTDVRVDATTGEVLVATNGGIVSYRGTATEGTATQESTIRIFPNPVRPDYDGLVGIAGLVSNAQVKITDVAGRLVYQTRANGGTATWNTRDTRGQRANAGVYLVFSADDTGAETIVGKIAVVR